MKILIDGDACPVKQDVVELAAEAGVEVVIVMSLDHFTIRDYPAHVSLVYVERGADQADFKLVSLVERGDVVVTQDYGLASLVLSKALVLHHNGWRYSSENIDQLLAQRHLGKQLRKAGKRTKGPAPYQDAKRQQFRQLLRDYLQKKNTMMGLSRLDSRIVGQIEKTHKA